MPFQRQAFGAQSVIHGLAITVGQELTEMASTNGTFHLVATIKRTYQPTEEKTQLDEPLAGKNLGEKGDKFFHFSEYLF